MMDCFRVSNKAFAYFGFVMALVYSSASSLSGYNWLKSSTNSKALLQNLEITGVSSLSLSEIQGT
jgi:hypothetical protein